MTVMHKRIVGAALVGGSRIDENSDSTPPVLLSHLTAPNRVANIPEFVNADPKEIVHIREQFLESR